MYNKRYIMRKIIRFSASLEPEVLEKLDAFQKENGLPSRSDALRALIREKVLEKAWRGNEKIFAVVTMLYDHHGRETMRRITDIQHNSSAKILVAQHLHLAHHSCMESVTVSGSADEIKKLADALAAVNGVIRVSLARAAVAEELKD